MSFLLLLYSLCFCRLFLFFIFDLRPQLNTENQKEVAVNYFGSFLRVESLLHTSFRRKVLRKL